MEIRWLFRDPADEFCNVRMAANAFDVLTHPGKLGVAEPSVQGAVADRVNADRSAPSPALGDGMMPFNASTQRSRAEPAAWFITLRHCLNHHGFQAIRNSCVPLGSYQSFNPNVLIQAVRDDTRAGHNNGTIET